MRFIKLSWVGLLALCVVACGSSSDSSVASGPSADASVASADAGASSCSELTYDTFGEAFLSSYCVSCHGPTLAENRVRLDSLSNLSSNANKAKSEVASGSMPPRGASAPSSTERAMFSAWMACGAN
ncbi:MAG: hypothetical protein JWN04_5698 [Myxococcaceae bacterium]|nr:hypothetical protein [Myxococcaceae bacterium]